MSLPPRADPPSRMAPRACPWGVLLIAKSCLMSKVNIFEKILYLFLEKNLALKFDICTCEKCRKKMMEYLLVKVPPCYVDEESPCYEEIYKKTISENLQRIFIEIGAAIDFVSKNMPHPLEGDKNRDFEYLLKQIKEDRGVDFSQYFKRILKRRIALRMFTLKVTSYIEYLKILVRQPNEYEKLFSVLTINVSEFFRDPPVWAGINKALSSIIKEHNINGRHINIWSAGCARGEEPYSLAMLVKGTETVNVPVIIHATDVDKECLAAAKIGAYDGLTMDKAMENTVQNGCVDNILDQFTIKELKYYIKDDVKSLVKFDYLDLTSSAYINDVDMIICRNVFIYFTRPLQERILDKFYHSFADGGYLVIGKSEILPPEVKTVFRTVDADNRIYQKLPVR